MDKQLIEIIDAGVFVSMGKAKDMEKYLLIFHP